MTRLRPIAVVPPAALLLALACGNGGPGAGAPGAADSAPPVDSLSQGERASFAVDVGHYPEMAEGRLDTVNMTGRGDGGAWQVQVVNYAPDFIAMTYAAWYTGPDSMARFAADDQPRLEDEDGNAYPGVIVPDNPRIAVEKGTTGVGVYVFDGKLPQTADSLTLYVNDSTPPVIRVGPWPTHGASGGGGLEMRSGESGP